jgi:hypothetical protein
METPSNHPITYDAGRGASLAGSLPAAESAVQL